MKSVSRDLASSYTNPNYVQTTYPAGTTTYAVNAVDQRVRKSGPLGTSRFIYAGQNQMLTEYTNGVWTSYIWLGNEPVAMVRNNQLFFIHGDHLGRPEVVTDGNNSWRWIAANYAFGRAVLGENNSIGGLNLGLPGQHYDAETGFWYNGMRDYDDHTGGYLQRAVPRPPMVTITSIVREVCLQVEAGHAQQALVNLQSNNRVALT